MASKAPDLVNDIYHLGKLEELMLSRMPAYPARALVKKSTAPALAGIVKDHFMIGHGDRVLAHREAWIDAINETQRPDGTWPYDPQWMREVRVIGLVSGGLFHLGGRPRYRIELLDRFRRPRSLEKWLRERAWDHPWGGAGHDVIGLIATMTNLGLGTRGMAERVIRFIETQRQQGTGLIAEGHFDQPGDQQFGAAFAFGFLYDFLRVDCPWIDSLVQFILSRQKRSGSWAREFPGGSYNMDAAFMLSRWTRQNSPLRQDALAALRRLARYLKREIAKRHGREKQDAAIRIASTLLLLQETFPSPEHRNRVWRYGCDITLHP